MISPEHKIRLLLNLLEEISERYDEILQENRRLLKELHKEATTDQLTGLLNRRALLEVLKREVARVVRSDKDTLCLCFLDLDNFKKINDTYGHIEGDKVLKKVAEILKKSLRLYDIVGRWGGDEFVLGIVNCEYYNNPQMCKRCPVYTRIAQEIRKLGKEYNIPLDASCGGVKIPKETTSLDEALKIADKRLYDVKKSGKGNLKVE